MARRKKAFDEYDCPRYRPEPVTLPDNAVSAVLELRRFAAMVWGEICGLFGASKHLVERVRAPRDFIRPALDWVRNLEMMMRRVIVILALSLKPAPARTSPPRERKMRRSRSHWAQSDTWNVVFRMMPALPCERVRTARIAAPPKPLACTCGLARRIEALRRVMSYSESYALRFARTLARHRARNVSANDKVVLALKPWDFHPWRSSKGMFAVRDGMKLAAPLATRELAAWQADLIAPG
jgi:hypothetical protein